MSAARSETRFAVLVFTDIVGSTDLKARHGVPAYSAALRIHNDHFEGIARECRGIRILHNMGDGYFAETDSVAEAVRFALLFQDAMRTGPWGEIRLTTRIGIHAGEVTALVAEGGSGIVAPAADLAARVMSLAVGGQILLTRFPFDEARHFLREHPAVPGRETPPLRWLAHGPYLLKGRDEPLEIFEVGAEGLAPLTPPPDGEKARRAVRPGEEETLGWRPAIGLEIPGRPGWRLIAKLGSGGFGEVWTGEHAKLRQRRAFKFCFDDERLRALKREVTLVRLLRTALGDRDDIVRLHELKLDEPPFFLESDLAPHGNVLQWAEQQGGLAAIPLAQRIALVAHTATALAAAHSIGVLHKDIKPTNILIFDAPDGSVRPRLVDFGIGTLADPAVLGQHGVTAAGFTRATPMHSTGTPTYSPPEYLAGKPYTVQGDIYGLGVLLYQLLTSDSSRPIAPGWERDITDPLLREDIAACVDGDPARRLPSAVELAERLRSLDTRRAARDAAERQHALNARRKRNAHFALIGGAMVAVVAVGVSASLFRERALRKRADAAEQLASSRLHRAQEARDAAEKLVSESVFGLREKLVPLGKINVLEDLAAAAENYYAKLPADLVTDTTRRHEVWLSLNRAIIANASSDDDAAEAACNKALALARELSAKTPNDESLREDQYFALICLAFLRAGQERLEDMGILGEQMAALTAEWLRLDPKSPGALRAKLAGIGTRIVPVMESNKDKLALLTLFAEARGVADELEQVGGETLETRVISAMNITAQAMLMQKSGQSESAVKLFAESDAAFKAALAKDEGHPFVREMMLLVRRKTLNQLATFTMDRDVALEKEVCRQFKELAVEETALAEFEPARLERWKQLGWLYHNSSGLMRKCDGDAAWQEWLEKGLKAGDRAVSPKFDRPAVRRLRVDTRLDLCNALNTIRPVGWLDRIPKLLGEVGDIIVAPSNNSATRWDDYFWLGFHSWHDVIAELGQHPEQRAEFIAQARAMTSFAQRLIDPSPITQNVRRHALEQVGQVGELLRQHGCPEAAELEQACERWRR